MVVRPFGRHDRLLAASLSVGGTVQKKKKKKKKKLLQHFLRLTRSKTKSQKFHSCKTVDHHIGKRYSNSLQRYQHTTTLKHWRRVDFLRAHQTFKHARTQIIILYSLLKKTAKEIHNNITFNTFQIQKPWLSFCKL